MLRKLIKRKRKSYKTPYKAHGSLRLTVLYYSLGVSNYFNIFDKFPIKLELLLLFWFNIGQILLNVLTVCALFRSMSRMHTGTRHCTWPAIMGRMWW